MNDTVRRRIALVGALGLAGVALGFVAFGNIGESLVYYWNPTELHLAGDKAVGATIRLGGVVKEGTVDWNSEANSLDFVVKDAEKEVRVHATGAPPQMFREGIGVVVEGTMTSGGVFTSDRLMVKHSNEYKAPEEGVSTEELYQTLEEI